MRWTGAVAADPEPAVLPPQLSGFTAAGYEPVQQAFAANFVELGEVGASCSVYVDGVEKVNLWGGVADPSTGRAWTADTLSLVYSVTKGIVAILCNLLAQQGRLELDVPVARYWSEFRAHGKGAVTVRDVLAHRAGLPVIDTPFSLEEILAGGTAAASLARQKPIWRPGTAFGYHALTFGWLAAEIVQRATGQPLTQLVQDELASPLGVDFFIGTPTSEDYRVASLVDGTTTAAPGMPDIRLVQQIGDLDLRSELLQAMRLGVEPTSLLGRAMSANGVLATPDATAWNDPRIRCAVLPAANGITSARSVARIYAACVSHVDGVRLLSEQTVRDATRQISGGEDRVTGFTGRFGTGFMLQTAGTPMLSGDSFGHEGIGGAFGFADPISRTAFGYTPNRLASGLTTDPRLEHLVTALRACTAG
jgi:CubicO group peptidase (beta-lactamase class C family)